MKDEQQNGWKEWSKFVLKELERLNQNQDRTHEKVERLAKSTAKIDVIVKNIEKRMSAYEKMTQNIREHRFDSCPHTQDIQNLKDKNKHQDELLMDLRVQIAKWAGGLGILLGTVQVVIHYILKLYF